jgi:hypothetical protein
MPLPSKRFDMRSLRVRIPEGLAFEALKLSRAPSGITFDWSPIEAICEYSGINIALLREQDESNVTGLIVEWYAIHRKLGGDADPVVEELLAEVRAEGEHDAANLHPSSGKLQ